MFHPVQHAQVVVSVATPGLLVDTGQRDPTESLVLFRSLPTKPLNLLEPYLGAFVGTILKY